MTIGIISKRNQKWRASSSEDLNPYVDAWLQAQIKINEMIEMHSYINKEVIKKVSISNPLFSKLFGEWDYLQTVERFSGR